MAKGRSKARSERDFNTIASSELFRLLSPTPYLHRVSVTLAPDPLELEDRRLYHPEGLQRPALATWRPATRLVIKAQPKQAKRFRSPPIGVSFAVPAKVAICVRRQRRKEVLHAKRVAGSSGGFRKRRRSFYSSISCKR